MFDHNRQAYRSRGIVQHYSQLQQLQPAEQAILDLLTGEWANMKMLDVGVGGGRTTQYFSQRVGEYVGIDYSEEMIAACHKRFPSSAESSVFQVADARNLRQFADNSFDFVLFSFNGIDVLPHGDRLRVLREVSRVGKPGGYFCFSSHNLQALEREWHWKNQIHLNPLRTYTNLIMLALLRGFNASISTQQLKNSTHQVIQDESHNFRLKQYYIRPQEQLNQLKDNFRDVRIYSWKSGREITTQQELMNSADMWLYYLCRIT